MPTPQPARAGPDLAAPPVELWLQTDAGTTTDTLDGLAQSQGNGKVEGRHDPSVPGAGPQPGRVASFHLRARLPWESCAPALLLRGHSRSLRPYITYRAVLVGGEGRLVRDGAATGGSACSLLPSRLHRLTGCGGWSATGQERRSSMADMAATTDGATW